MATTSLTAQQGFDSAYYLAAKAVQLTASTGQTWTAAQVELAFAEAGLSPSQHYLLYGYNEGLAPNAYFNKNEYAASKAAAAGVTVSAFISAWQQASGTNNLYLHYIQYGSFEDGVNPSAGFNDLQYYQAKATALGAGATWQQVRDAIQGAGLNAISHYQLYGRNEGLSYTPTPMPVNGQTYTLTTSADNFTGTATGGNIFNGYMNIALSVPQASSTLNTPDILKGSASTTNPDTFNLTVDGTEAATASAYGLPAATISGIGRFNVRNAATADTDILTIDVANYPGLTAVYSDRSATNMAVTNMVDKGTVGMMSNGVAAVAAVTAGYVATATTANLAFDGGLQATGAGAMTVTGAAITSTNITSTGAKNTVGGIVLGGTATKDVTINATSELITGGITGVAASTVITAKGAGAIDLGALAANVKTLTATENSGGVTATIGAITQTITGGSGNDIITTGGTLSTGSVSAGSGTKDRLVVATTGDIATVADGNKYSGFEQLQVNNGATQDASLLVTNNAIDTIRINDAAGATGVTKLTAAQAAAVNIINASSIGAVTIGVAGATDPGQIDTVKAALTTTNTTTGLANNIGLLGMVLAGVENLELTGNGTAAGTTGTLAFDTSAATDLSSIKVANAGLNTLTVAAGHTAANLNFDASGSTGNTVLNAFAYNTTTGASLTTGSGNDSNLGSAKTDILKVNAGDDNLIGDATKEAQTITYTTAVGAAGAGNLVVGGVNVAVANNATAAACGAAVTAAKATIIAANTSIEDITDNGAGVVTITFGSINGNVAANAITYSETATFVGAGGARATATQGGANTAGDTLYGGDGKDNFVYSVGAGNTIANIDTIKDLNFGTDVVGGQVDKVTMSGTAAVAKVTLTDAQQSAVTAAASLTAAADLLVDTGGALNAAGSAAVFTYGSDTYLMYSGATGAGGYAATTDLLLKVTGYTGVFDASDINLVS